MSSASKPMHASLWYDMLEDARFEAEQCGKTALSYTTLEEWPLHGNPNLLISALENVVRNAIKYGDDNISIRFTSVRPHAPVHHG